MENVVAVKKEHKMDEGRTGRRERRRRKTGERAEGNRTTGKEFEKTIENDELSIGPHVTHSFEKLVRRDTYTVFRSKSDFHMRDVDVSGSPGSPADDSRDSRNLTYSLSNDSEKSIHHTYDIERPPEWNEFPPVPAPRKLKSRSSEVEKVSSDTDRDVMEIDLDDPRPKSPEQKSETGASEQAPVDKSPPNEQPGSERAPVAAPVPKPRKMVKNPQNSDLNSVNSKNEASKMPIKSSKFEAVEEKSSATEEDPETEADPSTRPKRERTRQNELPLLAGLHDEAKAKEGKPKSKRQRKLISDFLDRKGKKKKSRTFSSLMKLEKKKIPKISSVLKDLKEEKSEKGKAEAEGDGPEFQFRHAESVQTGQIYVQGKSGFRVRERDEVLRNGNGNSEKGGNCRMTVDSAVQTAILLQKYWSRVMTYFHGVLAGFGFSHAATVTAIMIHCNYEPQEFIAIYSCLSLKIHYAFYTLTALCIVSCFDRIDVGHVNRKHWQAAWKVPSAWVILVAYAVGFALTLAAQTTETRFDALPDGNETEIWNGQTWSEIQAHLLQWYHAAWARDVLVLFAWLLIALTKFDDLLLSHVGNMARCAEARGEKTIRQKTDFS